MLKAANNDFSFLTERSTIPPEPEVDLLGGGSDDEDFYAKNKKSRRNKKSATQEQEDEIDAVESNQNISTDQTKTHRLAPQRGRIDELTDNLLDRITYGVPIKKQGRNDGVYLLGQKMMKVNQHLQVTVGRNETSVKEFIEKFERVESIRQKGLQSALIMAKFMQSGVPSISNSDDNNSIISY